MRVPPTGRFAGTAPLGYCRAEDVSGGLVRQFLVGAAAGSQGSPRGRLRSRACAEYASGAQFVEVGQALSGESVEQVGLGGADTGRGSLGAGAKGTADGHAGHRTGQAGHGCDPSRLSTCHRRLSTLRYQGSRLLHTSMVLRACSTNWVRFDNA